MNVHEKINYVEFPAKEIMRTKKFFEDVFGWVFVDYGPDYASFSDQGLSGGFYRSELSATTENGSALIILFSNSLEETQSKIESAGGRISKGIFSFPGGRRFHFIEPSGNEFGVWGEAVV